MIRKKLAIVTGSEATKETLCNQMKYFLEDCIDIEGFSEEIQVKEPIRARSCSHEFKDTGGGNGGVRRPGDARS